MIETTQEIREQFHDVSYALSNSRADYYTVGATKSVTVSWRANWKTWLCHTCRVSKCKHTDRVQAYVEVFGPPDERALYGVPTIDGTDDELPSVELLPDFTP
jgi:hypothetical protein